PAGSCSSRPISGAPPGWAAGYGWWWCGSVPFEASASPFVDGGDRDVHQEEDDRDQTDPTHGVEVHRPRDEEDDLDVEDDEHHRRQVVLHGEAAATRGLRCGLDTALIGLQLRAVVALGADHRPDHHRPDDEGGAATAEHEYRRAQPPGPPPPGGSGRGAGATGALGVGFPWAGSSLLIPSKFCCAGGRAPEGSKRWG